MNRCNTLPGAAQNGTASPSNAAAPESKYYYSALQRTTPFSAARAPSPARGNRFRAQRVEREDGFSLAMLNRASSIRPRRLRAQGRGAAIEAVINSHQ